MIFKFLTAALPLLLLSLSVLISQLTGIIAVYVEGLANFAAASFCLLNAFTQNMLLSFLAVMLLCSAIAWLTAIFTEKTSANPVLTGLALNLLAEGCIAVFSERWLNANSIFSQSLEQLSAFNRQSTSLIAFGSIVILGIALQKSRWGLRTRITGSESQFLQAQGIKPRFYRIAAWTLSGLFAGMAGSILVLQSQSFVPGISGGRGWIALATVFLGRKKTIPVMFVSLVFAAIIQIAAHFHAQSLIPAPLMTALPYALALLLFTWKGGNKKS